MRQVRQLAQTKPRPISPFAGQTGLKVNLGSGDKLMEGYINLDKIQMEGVHNVNLEEGYLPFDDESVDEVVGHQIFEHIHNFIPLINEIWRVLGQKGLLRSETPMIPYEEAFQDPTHVRFFTGRTWNYFHVSDPLYKEVGKSYGIKPFRMLMQSQQGWILKASLIK